MNNKDHVQTYKLKMKEYEGKGVLYCYGLSITRLPYLHATYKGEDDFNFFFTSNVEFIAKDRNSKILIDTYFFNTNYILSKNEEIKNIELKEGSLYKLTYNKIQLHD